MNFNFIQNILRFIVLVLLQVLVLNNFQIMGAINPKVYILFLFLLPPNTNAGVRLIWAFLLGLCIDTFENSGGIHASATLLLAFIMPLLYRITSNSSIGSGNKINMANIGQAKYILFITIGVFIHHIWLFLLEAFSFKNLGWVLYEAVISSITTIVIIYIVALLSNKKPDRI